MAKVKRRIKFECTECKTINYFPNKSKLVTRERLALSKFCKKCGKHILHKETK